MKLFDLLKNKLCAISGHPFVIDILVLVTDKFQQNYTTGKNGLIVPKSIVPDGFLMEIKLDGSMLSSCSWKLMF